MVTMVRMSLCRYLLNDYHESLKERRRWIKWDEIAYRMISAKSVSGSERGDKEEVGKALRILKSLRAGDSFKGRLRL